MVPRDIAAEVYRTVDKRDDAVNASWAPWWRAQARAANAVLLKELKAKKHELTEVQILDYEDRIATLLHRELTFADSLEKK